MAARPSRRTGPGQDVPEHAHAVNRGVRPDLVRRIQAEFLEMPGLRVTPAQAYRLWGLGPGECETLLGRLVEDGFLFRNRRGAYFRLADSPRVD